MGGSGGPARVELITSAFGFSAVPHPRNVYEAREMLDGFILKIASGNADLKGRTKN
jgi:hypothetical protein